MTSWNVNNVQKYFKYYRNFRATSQYKTDQICWWKYWSTNFLLDTEDNLTEKLLLNWRKIKTSDFKWPVNLYVIITYKLKTIFYCVHKLSTSIIRWQWEYLDNRSPATKLIHCYLLYKQTYPNECKLTSIAFWITLQLIN